MKTHRDNQPGGSNWTPSRERLLLLALATIQFTTILDFLIIIPLGPQYMRVFHIVENQFGLIVSAYGISAGLSGLAAGFFLDRFDRRKALLWLYLGFTIGTLFCALSPSYELLVASRFIAGAFGGVVGAVILSIVGDVIPMERRGAAMGMIMSSFSVSSIVGVPLGLVLANYYNWHVPFFALTGLSAIILVLAAYATPVMRGHMEHDRGEHPVARTWAVMTRPDHMKAYLLMAMLTCAGFAIFPYFPSYLVSNVGLSEKQLPWVYFAGGFCTLFSLNWVGRWADRSGKMRVFTITSLTTAVPILLITNLPRVPQLVAIGTSTLLFVCMSARMVPAMALMTASVEARDRGGFMSINSSVQQFSMGLTSLLGGLVIGKSASGQMTNFAVNGVFAIACAYLCIYLAKFLKVPQGKGVVNEPVLIEHG
ncbi:MAG: sugar transporter [Pedosphaera sp.]|nr:sugar transporter [Pedosphaera sp.]